MTKKKKPNKKPFKKERTYFCLDFQGSHSFMIEEAWWKEQGWLVTVFIVMKWG